MRWPDFFDCFYPSAEKISAESARDNQQRDVQLVQGAAAHPYPELVAEAYLKLQEDETERLKSIETRLGSVLGLTSITASLLVGGTFVLVNGGLSDSGHALRVVAALCILYLSLQIISSTLAAIRGLRRANWLSSTINDLVKLECISDAEHQRERAKNACTRLLRMEDNINYKVTQMAIAHTAIRNFAVGSAFIAFLGFSAVLVQQPGSAAVKAIRTNVELQKLLRGPAGPAGPVGPAGTNQAPRSTQGNKNRHLQ